MRWLMLFLVLFAVIAFVLLKRRSTSIVAEPDDGLPYVLGAGLFSPAERSFIGVLDQLAGTDFRVFGKVRVADLVSVVQGVPKPMWQRAFNRISAKHFDYVLCRLSDLKPLCVIELNDKSHARNNRKERDVFLERVCTTIGLPLIFFPAQRAYTPAEVSGAIRNALGNQEALNAATPVRDEDRQPVLAAASQSEAPGRSVTEPSCPRCSSPMARRLAKNGDNAGKEFWGCTQFPACRGMVISFN